MPKKILLYHDKKYRKYVYVHYDLYPTKFELTQEGREKIRQLYREVATKNMFIITGRLSGMLKIPKEKLEYVTTQLKEILPANLEEDLRLKKWKEKLKIRMKEENQ